MSMIPLNGTCVYWPLGTAQSGGGEFDDFGKRRYSTPVELSCHWEARSMEYMDARGTRRLSRAVVFLDTDVAVGGVLLHDTLASVGDSTNPKNNDGAWEIRRFDKLPDDEEDEYERKAYL